MWDSGYSFYCQNAHSAKEVDNKVSLISTMQPCYVYLWWFHFHVITFLRHLIKKFPIHHSVKINTTENVIITVAVGQLECIQYIKLNKKYVFLPNLLLSFLWQSTCKSQQISFRNTVNLIWLMSSWLFSVSTELCMVELKTRPTDDSAWLCSSAVFFVLFFLSVSLLQVVQLLYNSSWTLKGLQERYLPITLCDKGDNW